MMKSDAQIQRDVVEELEWEPAVDAQHVGVEVHDGIVALSGHVDSYAEKLHAEQAAQRVEGVKALAVDIKVQLPGLGRRSDADIASAVNNILRWTVYLPANAVRVMVERGWVTLTGEVEWDYQRRIATTAIRPLQGVTGVCDHITIRPSGALSAIKSVIEAALQRRAGPRTAPIEVAVQGGEVTLSGSVRTWSERDAASASAWGTPGVRNVVDNIAVVY